jgi:hypothetical protein
LALLLAHLRLQLLLDFGGEALRGALRRTLPGTTLLFLHGLSLFAHCLDFGARTVIQQFDVEDQGRIGF